MALILAFQGVTCYFTSALSLVLFNETSSHVTTTVPDTTNSTNRYGGSLMNSTEDYRSNGRPDLVSKPTQETGFANEKLNHSTSKSLNTQAHSSASSFGLDIHRDHFSGTTALFVVTIFVGFTFVGLLLLWRRHRFNTGQVICHYTTLNQELTLSANDIPETDDQEFYCRLDIVSDDETATDDDELLR